MTAKFGFQVTVQDRTIWIFPEDVNLAEGVAKAEAAVKAAVQQEIDKLKNGNTESINTLFESLPPEVQAAVNTEIDRLLQQTNKLKNSNDNEKLDNLREKLGIGQEVEITRENLKPAALKNTANLIEAHLTTVQGFAEDAKKKIELLKEKLNTGITYSWTRGTGEDPITLGVFDDLLDFIDDKIIGALPEIVRPSFDVSDSFDALVDGLPEPVNGAVEALKSGAVFELDGLRLKIPGKNSQEKTQFEIAMLINLVALNLELGPFQLNRLYAQLGNFGSATYAPEPDAA